MKRALVWSLGLLLPFFTPTIAAHAACSSLPYTLANGATADATQVMADLTYLQTCINAPVAASVVQQSMANVYSVPHATWTIVKFDDPLLDTQGTYSASTGHYTPTKSGKYFFCSGLLAVANSGVPYFMGGIAKNGTIGGAGTELAAFIGVELAGLSYSTTGSACTVSQMNGSTDFVEIDAYVNGAGGGDAVDNTTGGGGVSYFSGVYLGP